MGFGPFPIDDPVAYIKTLLQDRGFAKVSPDKDGRFCFGPIKEQRENWYSNDARRAVGKYKGLDPRDVRCFAKTHDGILTEMQHVDVSHVRAYAWYRLNTKRLNDFTKRLERNLKALRPDESSESKRATLEAQKLLNHHRSFLQAIRIEPVEGRKYYTMDVLRNRGEAAAYARFLIILRDFETAGGPHKNLDTSTRKNPTKETMRLIIRHFNYAKKRLLMDNTDAAKDASANSGHPAGYESIKRYKRLLRQ